MSQFPISLSKVASLDPTKGGGISAYRLSDGKLLWKTPPPGCGDRRPCSPAQSQAVTAISGAVFSGSIDGHLRAYATADGKIIWDFDTARDFETVNKVAAHGGSLDVGGPIVAGGMVFVVSGYPGFGAMPGISFLYDLRPSLQDTSPHNTRMPSPLSSSFWCCSRCRKVCSAAARSSGCDVQRLLKSPFLLVIGLTALVVLLPPFLPSTFYVRVVALVFINALAVLGLNLLMGFAGQVSLGHAGFFGMALMLLRLARRILGCQVGLR